MGISMDVCRRMSKAYSDRYTHDDGKKVDNESHIDTMIKKCMMLRHVSYCTDMLVIVAACIHGATPVRAAV